MAWLMVSITYPPCLDVGCRSQCHMLLILSSVLLQGVRPMGIARAVPHAQEEATCPHSARCFAGRLLASPVCNEIVFIPVVTIGECSLLGRCPPPRHFGTRGVCGPFARYFMDDPFLQTPSPGPSPQPPHQIEMSQHSRGLKPLALAAPDGDARSL